MTTPNPLENVQETIVPGGRQMQQGKRQRRPGRRHRKRPTTTETNLIQRGEVSYSDSGASKPGEPSYEYRVSGEEGLREPLSNRPQKANLQAQLTNYKLMRKPYSNVRKDSVPESTESDSRSDLKSLLKQVGGTMSLSEVLQQKNISLADLLNKKQHALAAISKPGPITVPATTPKMDLNSGEMMMTGDDDEDPKKHRRVPMFVAMPPHVYPTEELRPPPPQSLPPTISADASSHRRIPGPAASNTNSKPIKEVVSRIRPDFGNSNSKRTSTEGNNATTTIRPR